MLHFFRAEPTLGSNSGVRAAIGAVSVKPYPCKNDIPISCTHFPTFASIGAAADTIILMFPPRFSYISLNTFLLYLHLRLLVHL